MCPTTNETEDAAIENEIAAFRQLLERTTPTLQRIQRALLDLAATTSASETRARRADTTAAQWPQDSEYGKDWRAKAAADRRTAAIARAKSRLLRERIGGHLPRSHTHAFTEHPQTGNVMCSCGLSETAAANFDPDYVSVCCGFHIAAGQSVDADTLTDCISCHRRNAPIIHRDQWQRCICAACGQTSTQAGLFGLRTAHWRTAASASIVAYSCGGDCAAKVEAMRDATGALKRFTRSLTGRIKQPPRTK